MISVSSCTLSCVCKGSSPMLSLIREHIKNQLKAGDIAKWAGSIG